MNSEKIKLWGSKTARTLRPIWIAEELEIKYELLPNIDVNNPQSLIL